MALALSNSFTVPQASQIAKTALPGWCGWSQATKALRTLQAVGKAVVDKPLQ